MSLQSDHYTEIQQLGNIHFDQFIFFNQIAMLAALFGGELPQSHSVVCQVTWKQSASRDARDVTSPTAPERRVGAWETASFQPCVLNGRGFVSYSFW